MTDTPAPVWTPATRALWERIERHDFAPGHALNFTGRLARDKDWTLSFAHAAILEYRRFCFLAFAAATHVTPSEEVDEVWHLHLTYSRDYWDVWCAIVLGGPLHHGPTLGGPAEQIRFREQYAATLAVYETFFGPPPETFWPATRARFRNPPKFRVIDTDRWIALPRFRELWRRVCAMMRA